MQREIPAPYPTLLGTPWYHGINGSDVVTPQGDDGDDSGGSDAAYRQFVNPAGGDAPSGVWPNRFHALWHAVLDTFADHHAFANVSPDLQ